ncbi:MAG: hypothetical protein KID00_06930 [Clostridium argentinense]|uniref:Spore coat protein n=1 Tax=Clostridium faecium TaxID=2762223 RepID=A0ABR8YT29_9CLOT|nr:MULTISPECIES: hypothetical protein [Clostridium]MBD8047126.1 hypothetical protein [Clostridium faecium]MBS5823583.1 hypothetical protein [Clostridium argentinense]MDU1349601.1 hypothetical protein [Clostridium argentinense]
MRRFFYDTFGEYLKEKGIKKIDFILKDNKSLSRNGLDERVANQLQLISEFHQKSCGFNGYLKKRINNDTCKLVEEYKVQIKRFSKFMEKLKELGPKNEFEKLLMSKGDKYLKRAEECMKYIYNFNYMELISRSMKNVEVCLSDVGFDNLDRGETLEIVNFCDIAYNMVEMDAYYLLSKLKRKGANLNWEKHVKKFCELEKLDNNSEKFILAMLSYPHEFMKIFERYRKNKKNWSDKEYSDRLMKAMEEDGLSLISEVE